MMERFQSILIKNLEITVQDNRILRIAMNRHMPKVDSIKNHHHPFDQWLLYIRGSGVQRIGERSIPVRRGSLIFLPRKQPHGFQKVTNQNPLCLAIDLQLSTDTHWPEQLTLGSKALQTIEHSATRLAKSRPKTALFTTAAEVLSILQQFETGLANPHSINNEGPLAAEIRNWFSHHGIGQKVLPSDIATAFDMTVDRLNRKLKQQGGSTLGDLMMSIRFAMADELLCTTDLPIGEVAHQVGLSDQNYFTRWFRKQCGQTPSEWRIHQARH